jgi:hypothetical protein
MKKFDAVDIIKERFEKYLEDKFLKTDAFPESKWEFYSHLLYCAEKHGVNYSGYSGPSYKADEAEAKRRNAAVPESENTFHLPERKKRQSRHF